MNTHFCPPPNTNTNPPLAGRVWVLGAAVTAGRALGAPTGSHTSPNTSMK